MYRMEVVKVDTLISGEIDCVDLKRKLKERADKPAILNVNIGMSVTRLRCATFSTVIGECFATLMDKYSRPGWRFYVAMYALSLRCHFICFIAFTEVSFRIGYNRSFLLELSKDFFDVQGPPLASHLLGLAM